MKEAPFSNPAVLIPAKDEEGHIAELVRRCKVHVEKVLVVDDGSTDRTAEAAATAGAHTLRHSVNQGKGCAIRAGLKRLLDEGHDAIVLLDGDMQHLPEEIPAFFQVARDTNADLIVGSRMGNTRAMPMRKYLTNRIMSGWISGVCGQNIPDTQCGFRLVRPRAATIICEECHCRGYDLESEMLLVAACRDLRIASAPITTIYSGQQSKIRLLRDTLRFVRLMTRMGGLRPGWLFRKKPEESPLPANPKYGG